MAAVFAPDGGRSHLCGPPSRRHQHGSLACDDCAVTLSSLRGRSVVIGSSSVEAIRRLGLRAKGGVSHAADCPLPLLADLIPVAASDVVPSFDRRDAPGRGESEKAVKQGLASAA